MLFIPLAVWFRNYWILQSNHHMMANIWEKSISILAGNLNFGLSYLIATVLCMHFVSPIQFWKFVKAVQCTRALPAVLEILGEAICIGQASPKFINPFVLFLNLRALFLAYSILEISWKQCRAKPSLKFGTANAICWNYLGLFRDYGLDHIFLGNKTFLIFKIENWKF